MVQFNRYACITQVYECLVGYAEDNIRKAIQDALETAFAKTGHMAFIYNGDVYKPYKPAETDISYLQQGIDISGTIPELDTKMEMLKYKQNVLFVAKNVIFPYLRGIASECTTKQDMYHRIPPILANALTKTSKYTTDNYIEPEIFDSNIDDRMYEIITAKMLW